MYYRDKVQQLGQLTGQQSALTSLQGSTFLSQQPPQTQQAASFIAASPSSQQQTIMTTVPSPNEMWQHVDNSLL